MAELTIPYPDGLENAVRLTPAEISAEIKLMAALKMFELGKLSSGKAAELAGMSRVEFLDACGKYQVSVLNYPADQIEAELDIEFDAAREYRQCKP